MSEQMFDVMHAKMEQLKRDMLRQLNADLFRDDGRVYPPIKPRPWSVRAWWRLTAYLSTLWRALKGEDPYEPGDDW